MRRAGFCAVWTLCPCAIVAALLLAVAAAVAGTAVAAEPGELYTISREVLRDKIRGGWAGQMIGVAYGAPTEFRSNGRINESQLEWKPGMLENTIHQDDLYVEMTFSQVMDDAGLEATSQQYGEAFKNSQYHLWHANAGARRALNQGVQPPWSGHPKYNFHANDIDFQIEADFIGLMCPGLPRESNKYCERVGRVMNYGDGLYGGMFVCGMYAAAYVEQDPRRVVEAGLACIPAESQYGLLIRDVLDWSARHPDDWRQVWQLIEDKWDVNDPCPDGFLADFNIDAKINGAYIALGLLFGAGDFEQTIEISTRCGQDSDCNPSSAGGILGVMLGYDRIPEQFTQELPALADRKFDFTNYSFNQIVASTERRMLQVVEMTGGTVRDDEVEIRLQQPQAPPLEQWMPGIPDRRIELADPAWSWTGDWQSEKGLRVATARGCEATLQFQGVAVAVLGRLNQAGGRADVYLDGQQQELTLDAYIVPNTHDNVLWQIYDLSPGPHTLRIVTRGEADARSTGQEVAIAQAVVYRAAEADASVRWSSERAWEWYRQCGWLVGCNFLPSSAINQLEMFQADTFDLETIDRELGWAESLGFNSLRVYLHHLLWQQDAEGFLTRLDQFLTVADRHGIRVMFVLFDSCWDPFPHLGPQHAPRPHVHNSGWVQSPGAEALCDPDQYPALEAYVVGVVTRFARDPRVVVWDMWNEPDNMNASSYGAQEPADKIERMRPLLKQSFAWARSAQPQQPLTSGVWIAPWDDGNSPSPTQEIQLTQSDVISFHNYSDLASLQQWVDYLRRYDRPLLCTEYMSRGNHSTFDPHLGYLKEQGVSAYNWGLVSGKSQTIYPWDSWGRQYTAEPPLWFHDIFRPDGTPYREAEVDYIRRITRGQQ